MPHLSHLLENYPALAVCAGAWRQTVAAVLTCQQNGGTLFVAGNGGSGADAEHIAGEMLKGFLLPRPLTAAQKEKFAAQGLDGEQLAKKLQRGLRCVSLLSHPAFASAFANDVDADLIYAQQLFALARTGDVVLGISTSGNAENIRQLFITARALNLTTVLLTGNRRGAAEKYADLILAVPAAATPQIQELHLPLYHALCAEVEARFFAEQS
ncbi:MAG: SIS domain-containing protein [Planctomycetota bacterium]|jgi:D-sedoheptulose 7-phosphate isomerase|nr:SIS domain-containing protein [Planctomycetota bacterium]